MSDKSILKEASLNPSIETSSEEEIKQAKISAIKAFMGNENLNLDNQSNEELDDLLGKSQKMAVQEKVNTLIEYMEELEGVTSDQIVEALQSKLGLKESEAKEIMEINLFEKSLKNNIVHKIYEEMNVVEILCDGQPEGYFDPSEADNPPVEPDFNPNESAIDSLKNEPLEKL